MGIQGQGIERIFTSNHRPACNKLHAQILSDTRSLTLIMISRWPQHIGSIQRVLEAFF